MNDVKAAPKPLDISVEEWREYYFTDGFVYKIFEPRQLYVKSKPDGDSHRVVDERGMTHYIPSGWRAIKWLAPTEPVSF